MENMVIPKSSSKKNYFTKDTEDAIVQYNNSTNPEERGRLFRDKIHYAFYKLAENLIHTFKFYYTEVENLEDLKVTNLVGDYVKFRLIRHRSHCHLFQYKIWQ